ncbi:MAG: hypothetical protein R3B46_07810 [Phycisphaerales bacterium]
MASKAESLLAARSTRRRTTPEDWLIQRITGYRPDDEDALLVGKAILTDLSAFVELGCVSALNLTHGDLPDGAGRAGHRPGVKCG